MDGLVEYLLDEDHSRAASRARRARVLLCCALGAHVGVVAWFLILAIRVIMMAPVSGALVTGMVVVPSIVLVFSEYRDPSRRRPHVWIHRASFIAVPELIAGSISVSILSQALSTGEVVLAVTAPLIPAAAATLARISVSRPLSRELGLIEIEIQAKIRTVGGFSSKWMANDELLITGEEIILMLRPRITRKWELRISLAGVLDVFAEVVDDGDEPWLKLADGHEYVMPPGEAIVVRHISGIWTVPVFGAPELANVLTARVQAVQGPGGEARTP